MLWMVFHSNVLHRGPGQIEDQLIALQFQFAFRLANDPIGMFVKQFAVRIHHFRFHPDAEAQTALDGFGRQRRQAVRETLAVGLPIAQPGMVIDARIFVSEPAVVQQEQFRRPMSLAGSKRPTMRLKSKSKPVASQLFNSTARGLCPSRMPKSRAQSMQFPAHVAQAMTAPDPDHLRRGEGFARIQMIRRSERIDAAQGADAFVVVVKRTLKTAGPCEGTGQDFAVGFGGFSVQRKDERGILKLVRAHAEFGIQNLDARSDCSVMGFSISLAQSPKKWVR